MTISAVIFDMDGVLIDSEIFWQESEIEAFERVGLSITHEMCMQTMGMRIDQVVEYWFERHPWTDESKETVERWILNGVVDRVKSRGESLPGSNNAIEFTRNQNAAMAIASSSYYEIIDAVISRMDLHDIFDVIHSAQDEPLGKPHPGVYLSTAKKLGVDPSECIAIEDSVNGLASAKAAGMRCIVVPDMNHYTPERFVDADLVLASLADINQSVWNQLVS